MSKLWEGQVEAGVGCRALLRMRWATLIYGKIGYSVGLIRAWCRRV